MHRTRLWILLRFKKLEERGILVKSERPRDWKNPKIDADQPSARSSVPLTSFSLRVTGPPIEEVLSP